MNDIKDSNLALQGKKRIEWAAGDMPVLRQITDEFSVKKIFNGLKISCCLHVTAETANLMRALKAGGADILLCASNPLSTQDDVAASLVKHYGIKVYAKKGENTKTFYSHIKAAIEHDPVLTMDDGADLISTLHSKYPKKCPGILGSMEETTTGVIRLKAMERDNALKIPVIAVNDAKTKNLFDNRYGTGQSTIDGIIRATDMLIAGKNVVVAGYGWCGRGFAMRAKGMGANVIITEVDHIKAIEAALDGFRVMTMTEASRIGDLFCTLTGNISVIRPEHFKLMKSGAVVCNSGHFNVEVDIDGLKKISRKIVSQVRNFVDEYILPTGRKIYILAEGRLINLSAAEGHPASVMDMSFATQALAAEYVVKNSKSLEPRVYNVDMKTENRVAYLKLKSMGIKIDRLTSQQKEYLSSWTMGT
ncbi:adenosylhomocysteinase [Elusimicrobiota bacterium]